MLEDYTEAKTIVSIKEDNVFKTNTIDFILDSSELL